VETAAWVDAAAWEDAAADDEAAAWEATADYADSPYAIADWIFAYSSTSSFSKVES